MAPEQEWYAGRIPVDLSEDEPLETGQGAQQFDPGHCKFRCLGWQNNPRGKGKAVIVGFQVIAGPGESSSNVGRVYRKTFNLEKGSQSRGFFKNLVLKLGGDKGLVKGEASFDVLKGTEFEADLFERDYDFNGKPRKGYEIETATISNVKPANGVSSGGGSSTGGFTPST